MELSEDYLSAMINRGYTIRDIAARTRSTYKEVFDALKSYEIDTQENILDNIIIDYDKVIYIRGSNIIAKDKNGNEINSGTFGKDDTTVIRSAINSLSSGEKLLIKTGTYTITTDIPWSYSVLNYNVGLFINSKHDISIIGENKSSCILKLANRQHDANNNSLLIFPFYCDHMEIANLTFDGNKDNQTYNYFDGAGLLLTGGTRTGCYYHDLEFKNSICYPAYFGHIGLGEDCAIIRDIYSHDNNLSIVFDGPENLLASNFLIQDDGLAGTSRVSLVLTGPSDYATRVDNIQLSNILINGGGVVFNNENTVKIDNLSLHIPTDIGTGYAASIYSTKNFTINNLNLYKSTHGYGIHLAGCTDIQINNPVVYANIAIDIVGGTTAYFNGGRISSNGRVLQVTGNLNTVNFLGVTFEPKWGSALYTINDPGIVQFLGCTSTTTGTMINTGIVSGTGCINLGISSSGTSTISTGETYVDVTHGLSITPTINKICLTWSTNLAGRSVWIDNIGASTFRVNISSTDEIDHTFGWMIV